LLVLIGSQPNTSEATRATLVITAVQRIDCVVMNFAIGIHTLELMTESYFFSLKIITISRTQLKSKVSGHAIIFIKIHLQHKSVL
jgi:hypothetical protein